MPIYEFRCRACRRRVEIFFRSIAQASGAAPACPRCGSGEVDRVVSRVTFHKSEGDMEDLMDLSGVDEDDPKSMARWMRRAAREMGDEGGPELEEAIERMEAGEDVDDMGDELGDPSLEDDL